MLMLTLLLLSADGGPLDLRKLEGTQVELTGSAENAKGGAVLLVDGVPIYLDKNASWQHVEPGKTATVRGTLKSLKRIPSPVRSKDGAISAGAEGSQWVLVDPKF